MIRKFARAIARKLPPRMRTTESLNVEIDEIRTRDPLGVNKKVQKRRLDLEKPIERRFDRREKKDKK